DHIELQLTDSAEDKLTSRLLTPSALSRRVVRIDNIKERYNSAFIEGLITAPTISGHRLYYGDASRPNTLTFLLTGNTLRLSRDIAERSFIIRLVKPAYLPEWESKVVNFIAAHGNSILLDILAELKKPSVSFCVSDRYADWAKGVLSRCGGDTDAVLRLNQQRCNDCDEEQDDAATIMSAIDHHIEGIAIADEHVFITATTMTGLVNAALNEQLNSKSVKSRLEAHIQPGRLVRVQAMRTASANGYKVQL